MCSFMKGLTQPLSLVLSLPKFVMYSAKALRSTKFEDRLYKMHNLQSEDSTRKADKMLYNIFSFIINKQ